MWSNVAIIGPLATLSFLALRAMGRSRALELLISLRGTTPEQRPEIIHALNAGAPRGRGTPRAGRPSSPMSRQQIT